MKRRIATGIDIGTHFTRVVVVEEYKTNGTPSVRVIGTGLAPSGGMRHGYVVDSDDAAAAVKTARRQAESVARVPLKTAFLAVGGISLDEARATGSAVVSRADGEITELDMEKVLENARLTAKSHFVNRRVLHEIPLAFKVDGVRTLGEPLGMHGSRIEAEYLFITTLSQHADTLEHVCESADIDIIDCMASPLAGSYVTLTKDQKMKGCVLANVGAETLSIVVYDENVPVSVKVFPLGGASITDELALGFRVSLEDAERIKVGRLGGAMYPKKKVDEIVNTKYRTMFTLVNEHLKAIGKRGNLPAGIILSGGSSAQNSIVDIAKGTLALPSRIADLNTLPGAKIKDATWAVAYGLALWGLTGDTDTPRKNPLKGTGKSLARFLQQFLP